MTSADRQTGSFDEDVDVFSTSLQEFENTIQDLVKRMQRTLRDLDAAIDLGVQEHRTQEEEYHKLQAMIKQLKSEQGGDAKRKDKVADLEHRMLLARDNLDKLRLTKPQTHSLYLRLLMGHVNVKMWKKSEQIHFRDEYSKFKYRTNFLFIGFPLFQLMFGKYKLVWSLHQLWLIYYYLSLALRENILQANGSNIKPWWIFHHYLSAGVSTISLVFLDFPQDHIQWLDQFLCFLLLQGSVMIMQYYYQARRHYVRRSLGKASAVDVDNAETIYEKPTDLKILVPLLFVIYAYEVYFAAYLYVLRPSLEVLALSILVATLGVGNTVCTSAVLWTKSRKRHRLRRKQTDD